ncbi:uncharacterized protein BYT42DRAFT_564681 [Radiomyces spectabilis]|uniref:uncharacterized protein n=1 Tax=Radiomyces spectabilis TaxID=64574 RepID=UPI002221042E|nr:uncharacterized protein BYT42DRAFT_564681 [Radiomyces spectabilis]KAI8380917.1 hypothetical protein BYT42DRAFT_564681 [Radiomyces spectabilis]
MTLRRSHHGPPMAPEAKRWLVIGAHRAGATEREASIMTGLSKSAVRRIIQNFQRTGSPTKPRRVGHLRMVRVDQDGEFALDSDDEEQNHSAATIVRRTTRKPCANDLILYVLHKAQRLQNPSVPSKPWPSNLQLNETASLSPSLSTSSSSSSSFSSSISTPTSVPSFSLSSPSTSATPPSTVSSDSSMESDHRSVFHMPHSPLLTEGVSWTLKDDRILLTHMISRLHSGRWRDLASRLDGRHSIKACIERWQLLRTLLLKGIDKTGTYGWHTHTK